jgi:tetratricopeptide (TPR) repeat protein
LRAFRALEAALSAELGVAPDPETLALRAAVEGGRVAASPTAVPAAGGRSRLAVYVAPLACEPGDETMADDLGRRVTTGMSLFSVLSVIPAAFAGRKTGADGAAFADALRVGAGYLLTGALCRAGWSRHVTVGCIETRSGAMIWSGLYDFVEPDVVARRICGNLYQPLMRRATETARSAEDMSEVERLYLEAFHHVERPSRVGVRAARRLCLKVLELDPDHALCREHLAWLDFHAGFNGWCDDPVHALKRARENALVGVARADHEPYLLSALGLAEIYMGRGKAGLGWLERAVALNPNDVELHTWLGTGLGFLGHAREAHAAFDAADRISPGYVPVDHFRGDTFLVEGDWTSAISCFDRMLAALPEHDYARACRAAARAAIGDIAGAREDMAIVRAGSPALSTDWLRRLFVHRPGFLPRLAPHFRTAGLSTTAGSP